MMAPDEAGPKPPYEHVYSGAPYYGWPRAGAANFRGVPHSFECLFDVVTDDFSDVYLLRALDDEMLQIELELWQIFLRWREAFAQGRVQLNTSGSTGTVLPEDQRTHDQLTALINEKRGAARPTSLSGARAHFQQSADAPTHLTGWWVRWLPVAVR